MKQSLIQVTTSGDYVSFAQLVFRENLKGVSKEEFEEFYKIAPSNWAMTVLQQEAPSVEEQVIIVKNQDARVIDFCARLYGIYGKTVSQILRKGSDEECQKVIAALRSKPSAEVEKELIERGNSDLFELWINKFKSLEEDNERLICEDESLSYLKNVYIDFIINEDE
ncbi:MAG: hypothetical protein IJS26_01060 [Alphaproteobacteria bacterium]|nr:hypothetical protein [Alphaproteobacteria bacterium]